MKQLPKKEREELFLPKNLFCCFLKFSSKICETRSSNFKSKVANETGAKQEPFLRQTFNEIFSLNAPDITQQETKWKEKQEYSISRSLSLLGRTSRKQTSQELRMLSSVTLNS